MPEESEKIPVLAYLRVSTDEQTVENQRIQIRKYAELKNYRLEVADWFEDPETSGTVPPVKRPGFVALIRRLKETPARDRPKHVVVYEISRIGRNFWEILEAIRALERLAPIVSTTPKEWFVQIEDQSMRNLLLSILAWAAERERQILVQRTREGVARAHVEKRHAGNKPLGYDQHVCAKLGHLKKGCPLSGRMTLDANGKVVLPMVTLNPKVGALDIIRALDLPDTKANRKRAYKLRGSLLKFGDPERVSGSFPQTGV